MQIDALRQVPLFADLSDGQLEWVASHAGEVGLNPGDVLFAEGDPAEAFYVLLEGELQIARRIGAEEVVLAAHQAGEFTGAAPLLTGTSHVATARAIRASRLLQIGQAAFKEMLVICAPVASVLLTTV